MKQAGFSGDIIYIEYKSPGDTLNINTFYKAAGYACLYKSYEETADGINADDITISFVRGKRPEKLLKYFKNNNVQYPHHIKGYTIHINL